MICLVKFWLTQTSFLLLLFVSSMAFSIESTTRSACTVRTARKGRMTQAELVHVPGPLALAVLVGKPEGRWHKEITRGTDAGKCAMKELSGLAQLPLSNTDGPRVTGLVLIEAWRFLCTTKSQLIMVDFLLMPAWLFSHGEIR